MYAEAAHPACRGDLEDDVTHSDALPVWEPGKP